jgi:hypothetical protein
MSNRAQRRSSIRVFRKRAGTFLQTTLVPSDAPLDHRPVLVDAVRFWQANRSARRPSCIGCKAKFADASTEPAAFLFVTSPGTPGAASVSVFYAECWQTLPMCEVEANAQRVLRRLLPGGRLEAKP